MAKTSFQSSGTNMNFDFNVDYTLRLPRRSRAGERLGRRSV